MFNGEHLQFYFSYWLEPRSHIITQWWSLIVQVFVVQRTVEQKSPSVILTSAKAHALRATHTRTMRLHMVSLLKK